MMKRLWLLALCVAAMAFGFGCSSGSNPQAEEALFQAINQGNAAATQAAFAQGANPNVEIASAGGLTPLMIAATEGYADIVKLLIDKGADVNAKPRGSATAIKMALLRSPSSNTPSQGRDYDKTIALLKAAGAEVDPRDEQRSKSTGKRLESLQNRQR